jgi:hypothetical protein
MKAFRFLIPAAGLVAFLWCPLAVPADETNSTPDFKEIYDLLRANLAGQSEADLNRAAVKGLMSQLGPKATLGGSKEDKSIGSTGPFVNQSQVFDGPVGYIRIIGVADGLASQLTTAWKEISATNKLQGLVVDLRYAAGSDYAAAVAAAGDFIGKEKPLLDWGNGIVKSKDNGDAISLPVAVLVNRQTAGAAEALAAVLRESDQAIVLGATTAGEATVGKDFPLKSGGVLRIATGGVKLGSGAELSANGMKPDILVPVRPDEERIYYSDPFKEIVLPQTLVAAFSGVPASATNRPTRIRTTEADLIRERKERPGAELEGQAPTTSPADADSGKPVVHDPVLARALDLLKAISTMHTTRTP